MKKVPVLGLVFAALVFISRAAKNVWHYCSKKSACNGKGLVSVKGDACDLCQKEIELLAVENKREARSAYFI